MGSKSEVKVDHQLIFELWGDPYFWEAAPDWEADRESAEFEVALSESEQSSLSVARSELYNSWMQELLRCASQDPDKLKQITDYIHKKRKYRQEQIIIPATKARTAIVLSKGLEHDTTHQINPVCRPGS